MKSVRELPDQEQREITADMEVRVAMAVHMYLYHSAWVYERRRHSAQIPCTEAEPLKPGYIHVP